MVEYKDYFEMFEDISKVEKIMINVTLYNKTRGGGILWAIFYWILYIFSAYFLHSHLFKGIPNLLELIVFMSLFLIGCFLVYGVNKQMTMMRRWHVQQCYDYLKIHEETMKLLQDKNILQEKVGQELNQSFLDFETRYFPKKIINVYMPIIPHKES